MRIKRSALLLPLVLLLSGAAAFAADTAARESNCPPGAAEENSGICAETGAALPQLNIGGGLPLMPLVSGPKTSPRTDRKNTVEAKRPDADAKPFVVHFFWGKGCPHCEKEKLFLGDLQRRHPLMQVKDYEVWYHKQNAVLLSGMLKAHGIMQTSGVPITFIGSQVFRGFSKQSEQTIAEAVRSCSLKLCLDLAQLPRTGPSSDNLSPQAVPEAPLSAQGKDTSVDVPLLGKLKAEQTPLPIMTVVIAGLDSFNPCAFFVLLTLLGMLVHAQSRNKMLLIGGVFVFFSGFIYFLFMAAWLNLFLVMGQVAIITTIAGGISVIIAGINIKDFFIFKQGLSLTIPDNAKPRLFDRMRRLMRATSLISVLAGTTVLAILANSYELLCTAGFPMVFTRILTLQRLSTASYYFYLVLYNIVYVIPLLIIVLLFTLALGTRKLTEWQGRVLKLVSGTMMLGLGGVLLMNPALLNSMTISFIILAGALGISLLVATVTRRLGYG